MASSSGWDFLGARLIEVPNARSATDMDNARQKLMSCPEVAGADINPVAYPQ
jgi:hypothetical protein